MFGHVSIKLSHEIESFQANTTEEVWGVMFSLKFVARIVYKKCFSKGTRSWGGTGLCVQLIEIDFSPDYHSVDKFGGQMCAVSQGLVAINPQLSNHLMHLNRCFHPFSVNCFMVHLLQSW